MKANFFLIPFILFSYFSFAQTIKVKNGISVTKINSENFPILDKNMVVYSGSLGIEYLEAEKSLINTELGYSQIGGKEDNSLIINEYNKFEKKWNYLFFLTTYRYKFLMENNYFFVGLGPEVHYLLSNEKDFSNTPYEGGYELKKFNFGVVPEIGFAKDFDRLKLGLELSYFVDLSGVGSSQFNKLHANNFKIGISVGYKL